MKTYNIPLENLPQFSAQIDKLAKRAAKLGLEGPAIQQVGSRIQEYRDELGFQTYVEIITVEMDVGDEVKIQGWDLLAKIEHLPEGNIVKALVELDPKWQDAEPNCEHCNQNRRRNVTYVLSGEKEIQVGSTCLKDFTGHKDAEALAAYFEHIKEFTESDDYDFDPDRPYVSKLVQVEKVLQYAALSVRKYGYVSRKKADYESNLIATADDALNLMSKKVDHEFPNEKDVALAKATIAYVKELESTNNFEHNIKVLVEAEYVHYTNTGYIVGALSAHLRNEEAKLAGKGKEYVGTIKKRQNFTLTVVSIKVMPDRGYGPSWLYTFKDENDNVIVWFASRDNDLQQGETYTIKGTVKAHKEFNNVPQTTITRCKVQ